jgi:hypothetical protein
MTVIAYRAGVMAADTASWVGDVSVGRTVKIIRLREGGLFAGSGARVFIDTWVDWKNGDVGAPPPAVDKDEDFGGIWVKADGVWVVDKSYREYRHDAEFYALGAHADFLYGAMAAGSSAEEAVALAIRYCAFARGEVQVECL